MIILFLLVLAVLCFFLAAINVSAPPVNLTALGLFFLTLSFLVPLVR